MPRRNHRSIQNRKRLARDQEARRDELKLLAAELHAEWRAQAESADDAPKADQSW